MDAAAISAAANPCAAANTAVTGIQIVAVAVDQQNRRLLHAVGLQRRGVREQAGIAENAGQPAPALRPDMQRHHRALAEAGQRTGTLVQPVPGKLGVQELIERRPRPRHAAGDLVRIAHGERKPLPSHRGSGAEFRRVRRDERRVRQGARPFAPEPDQVVAVGPVAVQEHDEALRLPTRSGVLTRSIKHRGWLVAGIANARHGRGRGFSRAAACEDAAEPPRSRRHRSSRRVRSL